MRLNSFYIFFVTIFICSCVSNTNDNGLPNKSLIKGYEVETGDIIYQFYEEFGFDEICTHSRSYFDVKKFVVDKDWKKLPFSKEDFSKLKSIPNKMDTLKGNSLEVKYAYRYFFDDISLKNKEFLKDSSFNKKIDLSKGYYKIEGNAYLVYNGHNKIYYEEHYCN